MEFWGVEIKAGTPLKVDAGDTNALHISQASLCEVKKGKGNESISLYLSTNGQKFGIGTLFPDKIPQISYDLVLDRDFVLSHNWKNGSVHFCGYRTLLRDSLDGYTDSDSDFGNDLPLITKENGEPEPKSEELLNEKPKAVKAKLNIVEPKKVDDSNNDDEDSDEDDSEFESGDESMDVSMEDSSDEDDESSDEDTPKKVEQGKKRPAESASKTPVPVKKAKLTTPKKTGTESKKGGVHVATPHPSKRVGKTPANSDKSKQQSPKSAGQTLGKPSSKKARH